MAKHIKQNTIIIIIVVIALFLILNSSGMFSVTDMSGNAVTSKFLVNKYGNAQCMEEFSETPTGIVQIPTTGRGFICPLYSAGACRLVIEMPNQILVHGLVVNKCNIGSNCDAKVGDSLTFRATDSKHYETTIEKGQQAFVLCGSESIFGKLSTAKEGATGQLFSRRTYLVIQTSDNYKTTGPGVGIYGCDLTYLSAIAKGGDVGQQTSYEGYKDKNSYCDDTACKPGGVINWIESRQIVEADYGSRLISSSQLCMVVPLRSQSFQDLNGGAGIYDVKQISYTDSNGNRQSAYRVGNRIKGVDCCPGQVNGDFKTCGNDFKWTEKPSPTLIECSNDNDCNGNIFYGTTSTSLGIKRDRLGCDSATSKCHVVETIYVQCTSNSQCASGQRCNVDGKCISDIPVDPKVLSCASQGLVEKTMTESSCVSSWCQLTGISDKTQVVRCGPDNSWMTYLVIAIIAIALIFVGYSYFKRKR
jgi:Cys-rich repeat protein